MSLVEGLLWPAVDDDSEPFWQAAARGELSVPRCTSCGRRRFPPRPLCPWCRSFDHVWEATSGQGSIWSFVVAHPPLLPAYAEQAPYNVVVVELADDPTIRLVGNLVPGPGARLDAIDPHSITIGEPVEVVFDAIPPDGDTPALALPRWRRRKTEPAS